jgi:hypothetical protein
VSRAGEQGRAEEGRKYGKRATDKPPPPAALKTRWLHARNGDRAPLHQRFLPMAALPLPSFEYRT